LLPMEKCIEVMADVLRAMTEGQVILPLRTVIPLPHNRGAFASMPAVLSQPDALGIKVISVYPSNHGTEYDSHQGAVLLFEPEHGSLVAIMDASSITAIRTAAVSAVATRLLARPGSRWLGILGSGVQAETHLEAMLVVRPIQRVNIWSRNAEHAQAFADRCAEKYSVEIEVVDSAEAAVHQADIICTTTSSREPILRGEWLKRGVHVNAVGASTRASRELDTEAVRRSRLYVDRRESAMNEAGEFLLARNEGVVTDQHIVGELGDLLTGAVSGRQSDEEITLFKSLGLAIEDVASAHFIYSAAQTDKKIQRFALGGSRNP
jgi:ornithine cyclodeaminase/alanine dehydrogenase-like protein (mu-crystallin family)